MLNFNYSYEWLRPILAAMVLTLVVLLLLPEEDIPQPILQATKVCSDDSNKIRNQFMIICLEGYSDKTLQESVEACMEMQERLFCEIKYIDKQYLND